MSPDQMERNVTVYFPTEFYDWMESDDKQFQQLQLSEASTYGSHINDMQQILVPVYLPKHWGLIFIDLVNQELYFDDGFMVAVPRMALPNVKKSLELFLEIHPCHPARESRQSFGKIALTFSALVCHLKHLLTQE